MSTDPAASTTTDGARPLNAAIPSLLPLIWLASPALPVGGFSYSEGLEAAVEAGLVTDEASAGAWLVDQLRLVLARSEMAVVSQAVAAWRRDDYPRIAALNDWLRVTRESVESRAQSEQMGRSLVDWLRNGGTGERPVGDVRIETLAALRPAPCWPIAFALAAAETSADAGDVMLAFAFGWAENMAQAAMKTVPLGQAAAQRMLAALAAAIPDAVARATGCGDDARSAFAPMLAILSAQHETQYSRLFRS